MSFVAKIPDEWLEGEWERGEELFAYKYIHCPDGLFILKAYIHGESNDEFNLTILEFRKVIYH